MQWLTIVCGFLAAAVVAFAVSARAGAGVAIGTLLAWLNYRWLDRGVGAIVAAAAAQQGMPKPRVPSGVYLRFAFRYLLIAALVYVTVSVLHVPLLAVVAGLLSLGAGAIAESLYELFAKSP